MPGGLEIACLGFSFHLLSYYEEDSGRSASIHFQPPDVVGLVDPRGCYEESIEAFERSFPVMMRAPKPPCNVECIEEPSTDTMRYGEITRRIARLFLQHHLASLRDLAYTGYEHFVVVGWNGETAIGRGRERQITLPQVPAVVMAHTHPSPYCYPSGKDVYSAAGFFSQGGLVEVIVSTSCTLVMRLLEPFNEDDYWSMMKIAREMGKARGDAEKYLMELNKLSKLKSVLVEVE